MSMSAPMSRRTGSQMGRSMGDLLPVSSAAVFPITSNISFRVLASGSYTDSGTTKAAAIGDLVQQMNDVSGSNHVTQPTSGNRPIYIPSCALTGKPAVRMAYGSSQRLHAPSVLINTQSFTFYAIMRPFLTGDDEYALFNFGSTSALNSPMIDVSAGTIRSYLPLNSTASQFVYGNPLVVVISGGASNINTYINNNKQSLAAFTAGTVTGGALFYRGDNYPYKSADVYECGVFSYAASDADVAAIVTYAQSMYGVKTSWANFFGASGDSLTEGYINDDGIGRSHALLVADQLGPTWKSCNAGVASTTTPTQQSFAVYGLNRQVVGVSGRKVFCYYGGTNDFGVDAVSASTLQTRLQSLLTQQTAAGFNELYVATLTPRNDAGWSGAKETERLAYNTWLRGQVGVSFNGLIELANAPQLSDYNNTTYYHTDQLHFKQAARQVVADLTLTALGF